MPVARVAMPSETTAEKEIGTIFSAGRSISLQATPANSVSSTAIAHLFIIED
jgi:hypothetical protein